MQSFMTFCLHGWKSRHIICQSTCVLKNRNLIWLLNTKLSKCNTNHTYSSWQHIIISNNNINTTFRYVSFDRLGNKLITGIANPVNTTSQWDRVSVVSTQSVVSTTATTSSTVPSNTVTTTSSSLSQGRSVTYCDSYLVNQYSQWVRRYIDSSRSRITRTVRTFRIAKDDVSFHVLLINVYRL